MTSREPCGARKPCDVTSSPMFLALVVLLFTLVVLATLEQRRLRRLGKGIPGPKWLVPFIGNLLPLMRDPYGFVNGCFAHGKVSWNSYLGRYVSADHVL